MSGGFVARGAAARDGGRERPEAIGAIARAVQRRARLRVVRGRAALTLGAIARVVHRRTRARWRAALTLGAIARVVHRRTRARWRAALTLGAISAVVHRRARARGGAKTRRAVWSGCKVVAAAGARRTPAPRVDLRRVMVGVGSS